MRSQQASILLVDDDQHSRIALYEGLTRCGHQVRVAENGRVALDLLARERFDLVVADCHMPEMHGIALLEAVRRERDGVPVVLVTSRASVETAVAAMKAGAVDYLLKPIADEALCSAVERGLGLRRADGGGRPGRGGGAATERPLICEDPAMQRLLDRARRVAGSKATVLIMGESGTGKEVLARYIHAHGRRASGPFVALNCAALPEGLLESELFGHEKGAFTGAVAMRKGKFELADGGTLLLDEIGEVPLHLQAKLLRVLQEEEVDRLGGRHPIPIDVHVIATTNRPLDKAVREGRFREDLYYRLNVVPIVLPPLRQRPADIAPLARHFVAKYCQRYGQPLKEIAPAALARLRTHDWPGNVRELENRVERAVLLADGPRLTPEDFFDAELDQPAAAPAAGREVDPAVAVAAGQTLKDVERQMILQALRKTDNNRTHAARLLGVSVRTLRNKLAEYRAQGYIE
ncbi:MAG TPA: sigma-54-dependent Fis family transcriptional regulator [Desulfobacterales bacterium]|nr:sigma-54-dependent Fis family transcriptional regulator [Desulfobacterales bacterium]